MGSIRALTEGDRPRLALGQAFGLWSLDISEISNDGLRNPRGSTALEDTWNSKGIAVAERQREGSQGALAPGICVSFGCVAERRRILSAPGLWISDAYAREA